MSYTPNELVTELNGLGYLVTKRRLTDWGQKGLLPPLRAHGQGQGRGKVYRWEESDVVRQAVDVYELLSTTHRVDAIYLPLWLLGYDMPLGAVRGGLLAPIEAALARVPNVPPAGGNAEDRLSDAVWEVSTRMQQSGWRWLLSLDPAVLEAWLGAVLLPDQWPDAYQVNELTAALTRNRAAWFRQDGDSTAETLKALEFVRAHLSLPRLREVVTTATAEDLERVQADARLLANAARTLFASPQDEQGILTTIVISLGIWSALLDLALRQAGFGTEVDEGVRRAVDYCLRKSSNVRLRVGRAGRHGAKTSQQARGKPSGASGAGASSKNAEE